MQVTSARYLRVDAVAQMFDVSKATIYRAIRSGQLDAVRIGGSVRVPEAALRAFQGALDEVEPQRVAITDLGAADTDAAPVEELSRVAGVGGDAA